MTNFEIRHLRMVAAVAASGSVTRAASEVHLTQSAVSHQLRDIETRLGTPLFLRVGKRMVPTPAGRRVLATAQRVLDELAAAEDEVRRLGANKSGVLRVCAQCNTGYHTRNTSISGGSHNQHVRIRPLFDDEHVAIVAPDHPFASRAFVRPEDFAREHQIHKNNELRYRGQSSYALPMSLQHLRHVVRQLRRQPSSVAASDPL